MHPVSGVVLFLMIWWTVIFCVLPIGQSTTQEEAEEGEYLAPGAPKHVNMKKKILLTTFISVILWCVAYGIIISDIIDLRDMANHIQ